MTVPSRSLEKALHEQGFSVIAGIDEVGRGAWAGPVVAAAVVLPSTVELEAVRDSKALSAAVRRKLDRYIRQQALAVGIGWVSAAEVDDLGLSRAVTLSGWRALIDLQYGVEAVILDGHRAYLAAELPAIARVQADATELAVAAASIVAKVARDRYMVAINQLAPTYGFAAHKGYGTVRHAAALAQHGASLHHRQSYQPIRELTRVD